MLQWLTQSSLHTKEPGAVGRATHKDKACVKGAVMACVKVAMAKTQAWHLQLLQRGPLSSMQSITGSGCWFRAPVNGS